MKYTKHIILITALVFSLLTALLCVSCIGFWLSLNFCDGVFARQVSETEVERRLETVQRAKQWLGTLEGSDEHQAILEIYNTNEPLAQGYEVKVTDNWCATYGSTVAIQCGLTGIIPTECGCERQIGLWQNIGRWEENDNHMPLPGDYIYYNWDAGADLKDNTGWSDHVGIVIGTAGPFIKVIEGNKDDCVTYRIIIRFDYRIRGYGLPDYASIG